MTAMTLALTILTTTDAAKRSDAVKTLKSKAKKWTTDDRRAALGSWQQQLRDAVTRQAFIPSGSKLRTPNDAEARKIFRALGI